MAGWLRLTVGWDVKAELMLVSGTAVGFVECSDASVVLCQSNTKATDRNSERVMSPFDENKQNMSA